MTGFYAIGEVANGSTSESTADTTAPTLTAASATVTGPTTATGSVTTNEAGGTLYYLASTSATATAAQVKAGASKVVNATGAQTAAFTGLTPATTYYPHYLQRDGAATPNESAVINGASFTTQAASNGPIDATKVPASRTIVFPGNKRVVTFPGNKREVIF